MNKKRALLRAEREAREDAAALRARADAASDLRAAAAAAEDRERAARDQAQALAQVPALCRAGNRIYVLGSAHGPYTLGPRARGQGPGAGAGAGACPVPCRE